MLWFYFHPHSSLNKKTTNLSLSYQLRVKPVPSFFFFYLDFIFLPPKNSPISSLSVITRSEQACEICGFEGDRGRRVIKADWDETSPELYSSSRCSGRGGPGWVMELQGLHTGALSPKLSPPSYPQTTPNCAAQTRCIVRDKAHRRVGDYHYASQLFLFFIFFNSLFELLVVCCFKKKKKKKKQSSHFTLLSYFFFIFFLPFLVVKIWQKLGEDVTRYQGGKNSSPCWCCCTVCALANWATRCPAHSNSEVRN